MPRIRRVEEGRMRHRTMAEYALEELREAMRAHTDFHFTLYEASGSGWLTSLIRPAWDRSERFRPALFSPGGEPQERHRELDERLELASVFFARELGGRGIFER